MPLAISQMQFETILRFYLTVVEWLRSMGWVMGHVAIVGRSVNMYSHYVNHYVSVLEYWKSMHSRLTYTTRAYTQRTVHPTTRTLA